jgi:RimJ/RimL family protein N-acetyltransferase
MIEVYKKQRSLIASLFDGIEDSMVIAYLQGYMGNAYVASWENPKAALIVSGEYSFFGGDANSSDANHIINHLFDVNKSRFTVGIFAENRPEWEKALLACSKNNPKAVPRFGIVQKDYNFNTNLLESYMNSLSKRFVLSPFNEDIYNQAMAEDWSKEFCETFESSEDYLNRGFGFAVLEDGKLVSGASTMTVYDGGVEIQVATRESHRKKGLAMSCAAALVNECFKCKIRPCWDAANLASKKMALKLGYEYRGEYVTVHMSI